MGDRSSGDVGAVGPRDHLPQNTGKPPGAEDASERHLLTSPCVVKKYFECAGAVTQYRNRSTNNLYCFHIVQ